MICKRATTLFDFVASLSRYSSTGGISILPLSANRSFEPIAGSVRCFTTASGATLIWMRRSESVKSDIEYPFEIGVPNIEADIKTRRVYAKRTGKGRIH